MIQFQKRKNPKDLSVRARITDSGLDIFVNKDRFPVRYPREIWNRYPQKAKVVLRDNITCSATMFVPQIFNIFNVHYATARPLAEAFFFQNGMHDMSISALVDAKPASEYIKRFLGTQRSFAKNSVQTVQLTGGPRTTNAVVIPFSFGKESMLTVALAQELGLRPILVNFIEPSNTYEYTHKKALIKRFEKQFGLTIYTVYNGPGLLRSGYLWDKKTALGWGLQTTEYALLSLPFVYSFGAQYLALGNEKSCDDTFLDAQGVLTFKAGYDQHSDWTPQQGLLASLMLGRKIDVFSLMEPLYEFGITAILHGRYPFHGSYQMSCMADTASAKEKRWCQNCTKCGYIFALVSGCQLDTRKLGFTKNLFARPNMHIYNDFFNSQKGQVLSYGSREELGLAFLYAARMGISGAGIDYFRKNLLREFERNEQVYAHQFLGINTFRNIPKKFVPTLTAIYKEELKKFCISTSKS